MEVLDIYRECLQLVLYELKVQAFITQHTHVATVSKYDVMIN